MKKNELIEKLNDEYVDLCCKIAKLGNFLLHDNLKVSEKQLDLLHMQYHAMTLYEGILQARIHDLMDKD